MTNQRLITPPPELVQQWYDNMGPDPGPFESFANAAARWGADQELEACLKWTGSFCATWTCGRRPEDVLRAARRPKPPSLKEQALEALDEVIKCLKVLVPDAPVDGIHIENIRRAIEALPND